jgi:hypothetical protein
MESAESVISPNEMMMVCEQIRHDQISDCMTPAHSLRKSIENFSPKNYDQ